MDTETLLKSLLDCLDDLHNGGQFDLTDSPQSYISNVKRICKESRELMEKK